MNKLADLHIHTYYSDGTSSPEEVISLAKIANLQCIAITDHDTIDGISPVIEAAKGTDIEVITGIELSSEINGRDVHVLGYCFDHENLEFRRHLNLMQESRRQRMGKMIDKLKNLGVGKDIELDEVCALTKSKSVGRPHLATILKERGIVDTIKSAFDRYLAEGASAYVSNSLYSPDEVIALINNAGGVAVLAHPMVSNIDELIPGFARAGLGGLEAYYPNTIEAVTNFYCSLAKKYNLIVTGGSDAHGDAKKHTYQGKVSINYELVEILKERAKNR